MAPARTPRARRGAAIARFTLPVSGIAIALVEPTAAEDVLLAEHHSDDPSLVLGLVERLASADAAVDWEDLPITDVDTLIARLRQAVIGDRVVAETSCDAPACGERVDLSFRISDWLIHHRPRTGAIKGRGWRVERDDDTPAWYKLRADDGDTIGFRLPTLADQIAIEGSADPASALAARCIRPAQPPRRRARVEAAMARLAPPLDMPLRGQCPQCGEPITALFQARHYCLRELRDRARFVFDDIDILAERYHWSERAILSLPLTRRTEYVERARVALTA